mmetsp:Transcript_4733/g.5861  ORF Transcript_4733/g.5861 Transcript_4733/m.5861 type:complete len:293 (+) Transcript_4733:242-1120(+)
MINLSLSITCFIIIVTMALGLTPKTGITSKSPPVSATIAPAVDIPVMPFRIVPEAEVEATAIVKAFDYEPYKYIHYQPNGPTFVLASGDADRWLYLWDPDETNHSDGEVLPCHDSDGDLLYEMYSSTRIQPTEEHVLVADFLWHIDDKNIAEHMRKLSFARDCVLSASGRDVIACLFISRESDDKGPNLASASVVMNYAKETGVIVFLGDYLGLTVKNVELEKMYDIQLAALNKAENDAESERAARVKAEKDAEEALAAKEKAEKDAAKALADKDAEVQKLKDRINVLEGDG